MSTEAFEKIKAAEEQNLAIKNTANEKYREIISDAKKEAQRIIDAANEKSGDILKAQKAESEKKFTEIIENGKKDAVIKAAAVKVRADAKQSLAVQMAVKGVMSVGNQ